jgi:antitoxin HicB
MTMVSANRPSVEEYLARKYPLSVIAEKEGGYTIVFPDLPGCMSQVENLDEVGPVADEIRTLWIETAYEHGMEIPLPTYPEEYSGKFNLRIPRSLHRQLTEEADREGVSLNQYVGSLLARRDALARVEARLARVEKQLEALQRHGVYPVTGMPKASTGRPAFRLITSEVTRNTELAVAS